MVWDLMKKKLIKLILFFLIVGMLQLLVNLFAPGMSFDNLERLKEFLKKSPDILIFGDSTNWYAPEDDKDKRSISSILKKMMPRYSIRNIIHAAYHLDVYAAFCQYIARQKKQPRLIVIPINMRSFSPEWDMNPYYQFIKERIILEGGLLRFFYRPLRVLNIFKEITRDDYLETPVYEGNREIGKVKHMRGLKKQFLLKYMYSLSEAHRKVKSLLKIVRLLARHDIDVLFYLTPIDYQEGERYIPGRFKKQLIHNIGFLSSLLCQERLVNLSMDLTPDYFAWKKKGSVNEHLNESGRRYVAKKLAEKLSAILTETGK
jgi:hypothetical protein